MNGNAITGNYVTSETRSYRAELRAAERKLKRSDCPNDLTHYLHLLSDFTFTLSTAKSTFYQSKINSSPSNPRKLFSMFSSLLTPPSPPPPSSLTADDFVTYFTQKVKDISSTFTPATILPPPIPTSVFTHFIPLTSEEVNRIVNSNHATTCPLDPVPSSLLHAITALINSSLTSGIVPASFKTARIKPLHNKPTLDTTRIQNYRPASLLSFLSKTLERAITNQLSYISHNNLFDPHQSGFKKAHSTETALLTVTESLHAARASSLSSVLILLDLSVAFDTVNHQILLATLTEIGIAESALSWFTSYLSNHTYHVTWNGTLSKPCALDISSDVFPIFIH